MMKITTASAALALSALAAQSQWDKDWTQCAYGSNGCLPLTDNVCYYIDADSPMASDPNIPATKIIKITNEHTGKSNNPLHTTVNVSNRQQFTLQIEKDYLGYLQWSELNYEDTDNIKEIHFDSTSVGITFEASGCMQSSQIQFIGENYKNPIRGEGAFVPPTIFTFDIMVGLDPDVPAY